MILIFKVYTWIDKNIARIAHNCCLQISIKWVNTQVPIVADEFVFSYVNVHAEYQPIIPNDYHAMKEH